MAYRRSYGYRSRSSAGYGRRRASGFVGRASYAKRRTSGSRRVTRKAAPRGQVVRLVIEQAPASGVSRANERILTKMNPPPGKAKL